MHGLRVIVIVVAQLAAVSLSAALHVEGCWYSGDGLGVNLHLRLSANGQYELTWAGCTGPAGSARGAWRIDDQGIDDQSIVLMPTEETDMLKEHPIRALRVLQLHGVTYLVIPDDEENVRREGANQANSFSRAQCDWFDET